MIIATKGNKIIKLLFNKEELMKKLKIISLLLIVLLTSCLNDPIDDDNGELEKISDKSITIKTGTSFGMCLGYCALEATITMNSVFYESSSWQKDKYPSKIYRESISSEEWESLISLIDMDEFETLDDAIGCPDCADGGSEWIEINIDKRVKKVIFEYGESLKGTNELLNKLRVIRDKYGSKNHTQKEVYFNSFETKQDTVGWNGLRAFMMVDEPAPYSGAKSLYVGGGCIQPAASLELNNIPSTSYYVSFWGKAEDKNLSGGITFSNGSNEEPLDVTINNEEWKFYDIGPVQKNDLLPLKIDLIIGGIIPANMFIDNLRVYSLK